MQLEIGGVRKWQNVISAARALLLVLRSATHTEDQTEPGSQMLEELRLLLTAIQSLSTFVLVAYVQERLHVQFDSKDLTEEQRFLCFFRGIYKFLLHFLRMYVIIR